ncbi:MAG: hypothetical protein AAGU27_14720 [Dehalobacterium sp.]
MLSIICHLKDGFVSFIEKIFSKIFPRGGKRNLKKGGSSLSEEHEVKRLKLIRANRNKFRVAGGEPLTYALAFAK